MPQESYSLAKKCRGQWYIPILLIISFVLLLLGIFLPVVTFKELVFFKHTFSVLSGIISLFEEKYYFLGIIIFFFSIIFPFCKAGILMLLWFMEYPKEIQQRYIKWLGIFREMVDARCFRRCYYDRHHKAVACLKCKTSHWDLHIQFLDFVEYLAHVPDRETYKIQKRLT